MHRILVVCLTIALIPAPSTAADKYVSKEGKYAVAFPAKPKEDSKDVEAPDPIGKFKMFTSSLDVAKDRAYIVSYNDYPAAAIALASPKRVLELVQDRSLRIGNSELKAQKEIANAKAPTREYVIERSGTFYRARTILNGNRLYQVIVVGRNFEEVNNEKSTEFLDSFEIKE